MSIEEEIKMEKLLRKNKNEKDTLSLKKKIETEDAPLTKEEFKLMLKRRKDSMSSKAENKRLETLTEYFKYEECFRGQLTWLDIMSSKKGASILENA